MKKFLFIIPLLFWLNSLAASLDLVEVWRSPKLLKTPESCVYDSVRDCIYVSNINGNPTAKDGNGFISKLNSQGEIITLKWVVGLNAPKGITISNQKLYLTDIDKIVIIDINQEKIIDFIYVEDAEFLNDITVDTSGNIYFTDSSKQKGIIYQLSTDKKVSQWIESEDIVRPNGIFFDNGFILTGSYGDGKLFSINIESKEIKQIFISKSGIDGLVKFNKYYFLSDWFGKIYSLNMNGIYQELIDKKEQNINAADIALIRDIKLLLVSTFFDNRIFAYQIIIK